MDDLDLAAGPGVRPLPVATVRHLLRMGAVLYVVAAVSVMNIAVTARETVARPTTYLAVAILTALTGLVSLLIAAIADDGLIARLYAPAAHVLVFGSVMAVTVELHLAGIDRWSIGASVYLLAPIFGFYVLERTVALAVVAAIAVGYGALLLVGPDVPAPAAQWAFLLTIVLVASRVVAALVARADGMAQSALTARAELAALNTTLERRVAASLDEVDRLQRLREFLSPQIAEAIVSSGTDDVLSPHRRLVATMFCDLRGFTRFAATVEPEEVVEVIQAFRDEVVAVLDEHEATLGSFAGDGVMAWFGDPVRSADPVGIAVDAALALQRALEHLSADWRISDVPIGFGIGVAFGHATIGTIRSRGRCEYTAIGSVVNLASRLCDHAGDGEVLLDRRAFTALRDRVPSDPVVLSLKGFDGPVTAYRLSALVAPGQLRP